MAAAGALALALSACVASPSRGSDGQVMATATVKLADLKVGDCITDASSLGVEVTDVQVVPCSSPHDGEVYATESNVPNVEADIHSYCLDQFAIYVGLDFDSSALAAQFLHNPDTSSNTDVQCILYLPGQTTTQSYKGSQQ